MPAETLKDRLARSFDIYDVGSDDAIEASFTSADPEQMVRMFDALKSEVAKDDCFPLLMKRKDDYALYVVQKPEQTPVRLKTHIILFLLTIASTSVAGALLAHGYEATVAAPEDVPFEARFYGVGFLWFSIPLVLVLSIHEAGHYYAAKRRGVDVSLPYFIPLPPPFLQGTMGAIINLRDPIPNRRALVDIGASGPIAGFVVAVAVIAIGLAMSNSVPQAVATEGGQVAFQDPLIVIALNRLIDSPAGAVPHPLFLAGWFGMFITAMNMLPGGTLDGGHVARALFGSGARWVAYAALATMLVLGVLGVLDLAGVTDRAYGSVIWLVLAVVLVVNGVVHPQPLNDVTPLDSTGRIIGWTAIAILVLTFTPIPISAG